MELIGMYHIKELAMVAYQPYYRWICAGGACTCCVFEIYYSY